MNRTSVVSSDLASVGYDARSETLEVEFNTGSVYQYFDVPERVVSSLHEAASLGGYFCLYIRDTYQYERIR